MRTFEQQGILFPRHLHPQDSIAALVLIILGACFSFDAVAQDANLGQKYDLVVRDTTISGVALNINNPQTATVILYSQFLPYLQVKSPSIREVSRYYDEQRGQLRISVAPGLDYRFEFSYPGFNMYELMVPGMEIGESLAYVISPPPLFEGGKLIIQSTPRNATIQVRKMPMGEGNIELVLPTGFYELRISEEGHETEIDYVEVKSVQQPVMVRYALTRDEQVAEQPVPEEPEPVQPELEEAPQKKHCLQLVPIFQVPMYILTSSLSGRHRLIMKQNRVMSKFVWSVLVTYRISKTSRFKPISKMR